MFLVTVGVSLLSIAMALKIVLYIVIWRFSVWRQFICGTGCLNANPEDGTSNHQAI
jgi:hypothetical protein